MDKFLFYIQVTYISDDLDKLVTPWTPDSNTMDTLSFFCLYCNNFTLNHTYKITKSSSFCRVYTDKG